MEAEFQYTLEEMIDRIYDQIDQLSVNLKHIKLEKPIIKKSNDRRTRIANFRSICANLDRDELHVEKFFKAEILTSISVSGTGELVLVGIYKDSTIKNVLLSYIRKYVRCEQCKSDNTELTKINKLQFIVCKNCSSKKSID